MAEEEEVEKYKRLFEEQKAKVKDLERHNAQLKDIVQQLMASHKTLSASSSSAQSASAAAAGAAGMAAMAGMPGMPGGGDARSGGGGGGGPRATRARPGATRVHPNSNHNHNPPAPPPGGRGRGHNNNNGRVGGRGGGGGGGGGAGQAGSGGSGERAGQDSQGSAPTAAMAGMAMGPGAARSSQKAAADTPSEPDVRSDIVALLRDASMSKDKDQLTLAIKKAEEAGLHFEANQGRRQLSRITG